MAHSDFTFYLVAEPSYKYLAETPYYTPTMRVPFGQYFTFDVVVCKDAKASDAHYIIANVTQNGKTKYKRSSVLSGMVQTFSSIKVNLFDDISVTIEIIDPDDHSVLQTITKSIFVVGYDR